MLSCFLSFVPMRCRLTRREETCGPRGKLAAANFCRTKLITLKTRTALLPPISARHRSALLKGNERLGFARGSLAVWLGDFYDL
jgi:hypothetical protein